MKKNKQERSIPFSCPECQDYLQAHGVNNYVCNLCGKIYPIINDIPVFSDIANYYGEIKKDQMTQLLVDAEKYGYAKVLEKYCADPFVFKYTMDESRAKWINIIPHDENTMFLDVGCGWGTNSIPISKQVKMIYALDATYERVKFVDIRSKQNNITNLIPILGSAIKLPLPDNSVDVVAFNGVLEWLGAIDKNINPMKIQKLVLKEAFRVLKNSGRVYIGIENRYSLRYFLGGADDHSFIRFTSLMPRWLANVYCKMRTGDKYFTHTYSLGVYRKTLIECGFCEIETYCPWPDYRNPAEFCRLEGNNLIEFLEKKYQEERGKSFRRCLYVLLLKFITKLERKGKFCHSFNFIAKK